MPAINSEHSILLVVDFQSRLMPAIEDGAVLIANARRLIDAAELFHIPILFTEQNAEGLGGTLPELRAKTGDIVHKMTFDACRARLGFWRRSLIAPISSSPAAKRMSAFCRLYWVY
jgi:nicotinamidase-related amidase